MVKKDVLTYFYISKIPPLEEMNAFSKKHIHLFTKFIYILLKFQMVKKGVLAY